MSEPLLRARDVAERLDVSVETVLRWHRGGKLPGGRRLSSSILRFDAQEIEAWIEGMAGAGGEAPTTPRRPPGVVSVMPTTPTTSGGDGLDAR